MRDRLWPWVKRGGPFVAAALFGAGLGFFLRSWIDGEVSLSYWVGLAVVIATTGGTGRMVEFVGGWHARRQEHQRANERHELDQEENRRAVQRHVLDLHQQLVEIADKFTEYEDAHVDEQDNRMLRLREREGVTKAILNLDAFRNVAPTSIAGAGSLDQEASGSAPSEKEERLRRLLDGSERVPGGLSAADWFLRGNAEFALGDYKEALCAYDRVLKLSPNDAAAHANRGAALHRLHRDKQALSAFDRALALAPESAVSHTNRGVVLNRLGYLREALSAHDRALKLDPENVDAHINRGSVLGGLDRRPDALAAYDCAIELAPRHAIAHYNRGCALARLDRLQESLDALDTALTLGFGNCDLLASDPDLEPLREHSVHGERFRALLERCRERADPD